MTARKKFLLVCCLTLNFVAFSLQAKEGFSDYSSLAPSAVSKIWNSVFYVLTQNSSMKLGTASVVNVQRSSEYTDIYFLTNYHVIRGSCPNLGVCEGLSLGRAALFSFEKDGATLKGKYGFQYSTVEVFKRRRIPDLALLKVRILPSIQGEFPVVPQVIALPEECALPTLGQKLYSVGFPNLTVRDEDETSVYKRWSEGIYVGEFNYTHANDSKSVEYFHGTTVDLVGGGSGSPIVDDYGVMVGVMSKSASVVENNYRYQGSEKTGAYEWQSLAISCSQINQFIYKK